MNETTPKNEYLLNSYVGNGLACRSFLFVKFSYFNKPLENPTNSGYNVKGSIYDFLEVTNYAD